MKKSMILGALLLSVALPVRAQTPTPPSLPEAFQGQAGLKYQGESGGVDYWFFENNAEADYLIGQNRADKSISIGYLFDKNGTDISSAITGFAPMSLADFIPPAEISGTELPVAGLQHENDGLTPLVPEPGIEQEDNRLLENAPESVRNELLAKLVERLEKTTTQAEYEQVLLSWREEVRKTLGSEPAPSVPQSILDQLNAGEATQIDTPAQTNGSEIPETSMPPQEPNLTSEPVQPEVLTNPITQLMPSETESLDANKADLLEAAVGDLSYDTLSTQSRWFALGTPNAPTVYAVIDPTCPYCSETLVGLQDDVMSGKLQLKIVMAPLLSPKSEETIAGIMLSDSPGQVLFENAKARAGLGGQAVAPRNATDLPEDVRKDLAVNRQNVINLGISQIPYLVWRTAEGVQTATGVPQEGQFNEALPENEPGANP